MSVKWSCAYALKDYHLHDNLKGARGIYQIGVVHGKTFEPLYLGASSGVRYGSIYNRLKAHYKGRGNSHIANDREKRTKTFWFQYLIVDDAWGQEADLLEEYGIGEAGVYLYNKRMESTLSERALIEALNLAYVGKIYKSKVNKVDALIEN